jgi:hypothetical protein
LWIRVLRDGGGKFGKPKYPDFTDSSRAERIGAGDARARKREQVTPFDRKKLSGLLG